MAAAAAAAEPAPAPVAAAAAWGAVRTVAAEAVTAAAVPGVALAAASVMRQHQFYTSTHMCHCIVTVYIRTAYVLTASHGLCVYGLYHGRATAPVCQSPKSNLTRAYLHMLVLTMEG